MVDTVLRVGPSGAGWVIAGDVNFEPLLFPSGAKAEAQAHRLARTLASAGTSVSVAVHDRGERFVGGLRYSAEGPGEGVPFLDAPTQA
jgi:hypothetical protein